MPPSERPGPPAASCHPWPPGRPERRTRAALAGVAVAVLTGIAAAGAIVIGLAHAD